MWIELHSDLLTHPKLDRLANKLGIKKVYALGVVSSLWLWTAKFAEDGDLSKFERFEIASGINWTKSADILIDALIATKFLDFENEKLTVHDWAEYGLRILRQNRERQEIYRSKKGKQNDRIQHKGSAALNAARASLQG